MRGTAVVATLACAAVLRAPAAHSAERPAAPPIAVLVAPCQGAVGARAGLETGLGAYRVRVLQMPALDQVHGLGSGPALAEAVSRARKRAAEGRRRFEAHDPVKAEVAFRDAADLFEANPAALERPDELVDAYLHLARIFFATDRTPLVRDVLRRVVQLAPDAVLEWTRYPGELARSHEEVKKSVLLGPLGRLRVESTPAGAEVFLDGARRGVTPLDLENVPPGVHSLAVKQPGWAPFSRPVDVTSFRVERVSADLALEPHPALSSALGAGAGPAGITAWLDAVAASAGAELLALGTCADQGRVSARLYRASRGTPAKAGSFGPLHQGLPDDRLAGELLRDAVRDAWVPVLAARRSPSAGGGALDETAPFGVHTSLFPGTSWAAGSRNYPSGTGVALRVGLDYRLRRTLVASAESGVETYYDPSADLVGRGGAALNPDASSTSALRTSIPLEASVRWYPRLAVWAPFAFAGAGVSYERIRWIEGMADSSVTDASGFGASAFGGAGVERVLGLRDGIRIEARAATGAAAFAPTSARSGGAQASIRVDPGVHGTVALGVSWLRVF